MNLHLQRSDPLISRLHGQIQRFLKLLGSKFLKIEVVANESPSSIDFKDIQNQKAGNNTLYDGGYHLATI